MANFFDQFDAQPAAGGNFFDQFDTQPQTAPAAGLSAAITDIPHQIYQAGASALGDIAGTFNPNSDANAAKMERMKNASFLGGMGDQVQNVLDTGKALMAVPALAAAPVTGTARSVIGHTFDALDPLTPDQVQKAGLPSGAQVADTAMSALAPRGASPVGLRTTPAPIPTAPELKSAATAGYDAAKNSGVELKPSSIQNFTTKTQADLNADGLNEVLAPKTFGVLDKLGNPPPGATVTTNDFRTMQRALGHAASSPDPTERLAATRAISALNDHIENLPAADILKGTPADAAAVSDTIKTANANYGAYKRSEDFNLRGNKANNNADAANSGMNLENNLRTQVRQILNNPKLQRGYDPETLAAFKAFNRGSKSANVLRAVGNILGGGGGVVGTALSGGAGLMAGGPIGAVAAPVAGFAAKSLGNSLSARQFAKLSELIRSKSPLAQSLPPQVAPQLGGIGNSLAAPLLSSAAPRALFPFLSGQVPAYADQNQRR